MHGARYSEFAGHTRQGVDIPLLSSCEYGERYYVRYLPAFERSSDSTMVEEPKA